MCGLLFAKSFDGKPVNRLIVDQYQNQVSRGASGFGIVYENPDHKLVVERATEPVKFLLDLHPHVGAPSDMILAHHRTPTSTPNLTGQTHPIFVSNELLKFNYYITHNGIIYNAEERKKAHDTLGFKYTTLMQEGALEKFNDSEALAVDLALYIERFTDKVEARGSAAYIGLQVDKVTGEAKTLFFGRNTGNPLHFSRDQKLIMLSSQGKGEMVEFDTITFIYLDNPKFKQKTYKLEIPYSYQVSTTRSYSASTDKPDDKTTAEQKQLTAAEEEEYGYGYHGRGGNHFDTINGVKTEEVAEEDYDTPLASRIAEIETDLEDRLALFMDTLSASEDIAEGQVLIADIVEAMQDYLSEIQDWYKREATDDLDEQFKRQVEHISTGKE